MELRHGMRGDAVRELQAALNRQFPQWKQLPLTGYFGPETFEFVVSAQHALDFPPNGIASDAFQRWIGVASASAATIPIFTSGPDGSSSGGGATTTDAAARALEERRKREQQQTWIMLGVGLVAVVFISRLAGD